MCPQNQAKSPTETPNLALVSAPASGVASTAGSTSPNKLRPLQPRPSPPHALPILNQSKSVIPKELLAQALTQAGFPAQQLTPSALQYAQNLYEQALTQNPQLVQTIRQAQTTGAALFPVLAPALSEAQQHQRAISSNEEQLAVRVRRRRANHNEIERNRRIIQKQRLEELRLCIPTLSNDAGASIISIISRAKDYIDMLKGRVTELENFSRSLMDNNKRGAFTNPGDLLFNSHHAAVHELTVNGILANEPHVANSVPMQHQPIMPRRKSSLIFPTGDQNLLFGQRDSLQALFAGIMPSLLEDTSQFDIKCQKCAGGINNLIMIDCDRCHGWYHIRCVGINTSTIPSSWICSECH